MENSCAPLIYDATSMPASVAMSPVTVSGTTVLPENEWRQKLTGHASESAPVLVSSKGHHASSVKTQLSAISDTTPHMFSSGVFLRTVLSVGFLFVSIGTRTYDILK